MIADMDADGAADVLILSATKLALSLNDGHQGFRPAVFFDTGPVALGMVTGDFNTDGLPEVAVLCSAIPGRVDFFQGQKNGTLIKIATLNVGTGLGTSIATGDLDNDGRLDLVVAGQSAVVWVVRNLGQGAWAAPVSLVPASACSSIYVADVDNDGDLDLVGAGLSTPSAVAVFRNAGNGTFAAPVSFSFNGYLLPQMVLEDLNQDGFVDIAALTSTTGGAKIFCYNDGAGNFTTASSTSGSDLQCLAILDTTGDGKPDCLTSSYSASSSFPPEYFTSIPNIGGGNFSTSDSAAVKYWMGGTGVTDLQVGDLDGDGVRDVLSVCKATQSASVMFGKSGGGFRGPSVLPGSGSLLDVWVGDITGDGNRDLIVGTNAGLKVCQGDANGVLTVRSTHFTNSVFTELTVGDFDGDGDLDVFANRVSSPPCPVVLRNNGSAGFTTMLALPAVGPIPGTRAFDVSGDGKLDVVCLAANKLITVSQNAGDGTFLADRTFATGSDPIEARFGDVDGDGNTDVVVGSSSQSKLYVHLNHQDGTLPASFWFDLNGFVFDTFWLSDMNGDNRADALVLDQDGALAIYLATQTGNFQFGTVVSVLPGTTTLATGDVDGDGDKDIMALVANSNDRMTLFTQEPGFIFALRAAYAPGGGSSAIIAVDMNGDSLTDWITRNGGPVNGTLYLNGGGMADDDNDGVPNCEDLCPGSDDRLDADLDGIPDGCDQVFCPGDYDGDKLVNGSDLGVLLGAWGTWGQAARDVDLNGDGAVDGEDLGLLLSRWGACGDQP